MKKQEGVPGMRKEQGIPVFHSGTPLRPLTAERILRIGRLERERRIMGGRAREALARNSPEPKL
jgi:hypothetical protein